MIEVQLVCFVGHFNIMSHKLKHSHLMNYNIEQNM